MGRPPARRGPIYRLSADATPIKLHGKFLVEEAEARVLVRDLAKAQRTSAVAEGK